jgi:hypothetical protein
MWKTVLNLELSVVNEVRLHIWPMHTYVGSKYRKSHPQKNIPQPSSIINATSSLPSSQPTSNINTQKKNLNWS